jgi:carboxylesterase type B
MVGGAPEEQTRAQAMADAVAESYIAFANSGNPNNKHVPQWPTFDLTRRATMIFDDKVRGKTIHARASANTSRKSHTSPTRDNRPAC